ncbi:MAG TPA: UbiA family prenyltransferase [Ktedonobacterales bacterium]|nr:UbiA family prenyltransferase [Ktedonobacterales bacterium]
MDQIAPSAGGVVPKGSYGLMSRRRRSRSGTSARMVSMAIAQPQSIVTHLPASPISYLHAIRLTTVWLGLAPAVAGLALLWAQGSPVEPVSALSVLAAVTLGLLGANVLDEQREQERDANGTLLPLASQPEVMPPAAVSRPSGPLLLGLAALAGLPAALAGGTAVLTLGAVSLLAAFFYSATSQPWKRLPGSELVVAAALGPGVMAATIAGQGLRLGPAELLLGVALGLLALAVAEAAHLRDAPLHAASGRRTLVTMLGWSRGRLLAAVPLFGAFAVALGVVAAGPGAAEGAALSLLALPAGLAALIGGLRASTSSARHVAYHSMLRAHALFALSLVAGIVLVGILLRIAPYLVP